LDRTGQSGKRRNALDRRECGGRGSRARVQGIAAACRRESGRIESACRESSELAGHVGWGGAHWLVGVEQDRNV